MGCSSLGRSGWLVEHAKMRFGKLEKVEENRWYAVETIFGGFWGWGMKWYAVGESGWKKRVTGLRRRGGLMCLTIHLNREGIRELVIATQRQPLHGSFQKSGTLM